MSLKKRIAKRVFKRSRRDLTFRSLSDSPIDMEVLWVSEAIRTLVQRRVLLSTYWRYRTQMMEEVNA